ncbi:hypothetical protein [Umboniibacter marinipuniceus]|uniref:Uncharacterized protein n=1 Tax=Umboniibacter marinipuniceus TaxID=569599 RepID=A0A3M0AUB8_9GAMM|nr:hypothetical protein [Umboniibacter marinipuniceus]RMA82552.1 hypothetical protein DFR27_0502 [Umboniibacter marinipuniceus]
MPNRQTLFAFLTSTLVTFILASLFNTQFVIAGLESVNVVVPFSDRARMSWLDLQGLAFTYGIVILIGLLLAFWFMSFVNRFKALPKLWFPLGGAIAFIVMIAAMEPLLGVTLITGARTLLGWAAQCAAGALGGLVFSYLNTPAATVTD